MFKMDPETIYLLKDFDNRALFPGPSGRFNPSHVDPRCTYEVLGDDASSALGRARDTSQPFGAYSSFNSSQMPSSSSSSGYPRPHPPPSYVGKARQQPKVRKNIVLVTLSLPDSDKPSSSKTLTYSVVTQTQVNVDSSSCTPTAVSSLVSRSVGFDVVLLDSKCYPLLHNEATTVLEFWKSTRKILAASKVSYEKLTGKVFSSTIDLTKNEDDNSNSDCLPKRKCRSDVTLSRKIEKVHTAIDKLQKGFDFLGSFAKSFECIICKSTCKKPMVAECCQRVVGCESCVSRWSDSNNSCPHCSCDLLQRVQLKDMLLLASVMLEHGREDSPLLSPQVVHTREEESSNSDFEFPPRFRRPN